MIEKNTPSTQKHLTSSSSSSSSKSSNHHSHQNPQRYGKLVWVPFTNQGVPLWFPWSIHCIHPTTRMSRWKLGSMVRKWVMALRSGGQKNVCVVHFPITFHICILGDLISYQLCRLSAPCIGNCSQSFLYIHIYTHNIYIIYDQTMFQHGWLQAWLGSGWGSSGTTLNKNRRLLPGCLFF